MNFSYINAPSGAQKHALKNTLLRQVCVCLGETIVTWESVSGDHIFVISATCSVLSCFAVSDCHSLLTAICVACCSDAFWLKANQSVCTHEMSLVCCVTKKGASLRLSFVIIIFLTCLSETIQEKRKESLQFCGFLSSVCCIPSRTVYTERSYQHPQSGSGARG